MKKLFKALLIILAVFAVGIIIILAIPDSWLETEEEPTAAPVLVQNNDSGNTVKPTQPPEVTQVADAEQAETTASGKADAGTIGAGVTGLESSLLSGEMLAEGAIKEKADYSKAKTVTILCYVNGSDLETEYSEATTDISEMVAAPYNSNVNILIQTMGTKRWDRKYKIASDRSQRYLVKEDTLELVDDSLGQLDCTRSSTLSDFISWGAKNYPADRYILLFWDHGGGPVYGFGYDEFQSYEDTMTIDEMQLALATAGVTFDFIGMDCCIMSCLEVCCAMYGYCDYMLLAEDFEPGLGWSYKGWMTALSQNPAIDTVSLGTIICDDCIRANETDPDGDECILSLIDESVMKVLFAAWKNFAYANEKELLGSNYSRPLKRGHNYRISPRFGFFETEEYSLSDYNITDIMSVAQNIDSSEAQALSSALKCAIVHCAATSGDSHLTGLSVTLPYGDTEFYSSLRGIFRNCGLDEEYIEWLGGFTSVSNDSDSLFDFGSWDSYWSGWDDYEDDYDWEDWEYSDDEDYWEDDSESWWDWNFLDFWDDDWGDYDDNDYHYDGYCSDDYWDEYGYYYDDYWDGGRYGDYGWDYWSGWGDESYYYDDYYDDSDYYDDDDDYWDFFYWLMED